MGGFLQSLAAWAQIIALPVAVIAVIVSVWLYKRGKQIRALSCVLAPLVSLVEVKAGDALGGDIEVLYKGKKVKNLFVVCLTLRNTGNMPIRREDVREPVTFKFAEGTELLREPAVLRAKPDNLEVGWAVWAGGSPALAVMEFDLLNPVDELTVEFVCTGAKELPSVAARMEGISGIEMASVGDLPRRRRQGRVWVFLLFLALAAVGFALCFRGIYLRETIGAAQGKVVSLVGVGLVFASVVLMLVRTWPSLRDGPRRVFFE